MLTLDPDTFGRAFGRAPFAFAHELAGHPLLQLARLVALSRALPPASIEFNAGDLPVSLDGASPRTGLSVEETIQGIERHRSWMVLQNVEQHAAYRRLMDDCLAEIRPLADPLRPGARQPEAFVFVSSPGAVTPYHMDPEHGFLLQIRGRKVVTVFDGSHADVVDAPALERFYSGVRHRNMPISPSAHAHATTWPLGPGDGVHIPVTFPHFVQVGPEAYSISLSVTFRTPDLGRRASAHYFNAFLRRRGFEPAPVGRSAAADLAKASAGAAVAAVRRIVSRDPHGR